MKWPKPYIHRRVHFTNGIPDRTAETAVRFAITPTGQVSRAKGGMEWWTVYDKAKTRSKESMLEQAKRNLEKHGGKPPRGCTWGPILEYPSMRSLV